MNSKALRPIFFAAFLFFAHLSVVMYVNSTVLSNMAGTKTASILYVLGAAGSIVLLFWLPRIVQSVGLLRTAIAIFLMLTASLVLLGTVSGMYTFIGIFVLYTALYGTVWYCNDLFVSHYAEYHTMGRTRGTYLTLINAAIALMPVIAGVLVQRSGFHSIYIVAAALLFIATITIAYSQRHFVDRPYSSSTIPEAWKVIRISPSLRRVVVINFLLQFFYAWMTIFTPLYMVLILHFSWAATGLTFTVMLTAFVLLQYLVGRWADRIGEKKLLSLGFLIAAISTVVFARIHSPSIVPYTIALFFTRVCICMVEVLGETYFFKQITDRDEGVVSVYRMMYPLSYIIAPLLGWAIISAGSYTALFYTLGAILLFGTFYTLRLIDIR